MNPFVAGLLSALPLSALGIAYMLFAGGKFVALLTSGGGGEQAFSESQARLLMLGSFALAPLAFGLVSALVYRWVASPNIFTSIALGAAVVMSLLVLVTRTPMTVEKIVMNFLVGLAFGLLLPYLARMG